MSNRYPYQLFLQWLSVVLVVIFGGFLAWQYGFLATLFENDKSYISSIIMFIFMLTTISAGFRVLYLSRELQHAQQINDVIRHHDGAMELAEDGRVQSRDFTLPDCLLQTQLYKQLMRKRNNSQITCGSPVMLENLEKDISGNHEFGWLIADMMIKLGLLGTVIGFIVMLGSVAVIENADITTIQNMLTDMSGGMRIALFTTLTGLLAGLLLGLQYHFIDRAASRLMAIISDTVETYIGQQ